jgi:uncharacterized membrane protein
MADVDAVYLSVLVFMIIVAIVIFLRVQLYLADPRRRELNEQWFARFEEYMRRRYSDGELNWRTYILEAQFREPRNHGRSRMGGGGHGGSFGAAR